MTNTWMDRTKRLIMCSLFDIIVSLYFSLLKKSNFVRAKMHEDQEKKIDRRQSNLIFGVAVSEIFYFAHFV